MYESAQHGYLIVADSSPVVMWGLSRDKAQAWRPTEFILDRDRVGWRVATDPIADTRWRSLDSITGVDEVADHVELNLEITFDNGSTLEAQVPGGFQAALLAALNGLPIERSDPQTPLSTKSWRRRLIWAVPVLVIVGVISALAATRQDTNSGREASNGSQGSSSERSANRQPDATSTVIPEVSVATTPPTESTVSAPVVTTPSTSHVVPTQPPTMTINGSVSFLKSVGFEGIVEGRDSSGPANGDQCSGTRGYSDIVPGASVVISDSTGRALAVVPLQAGSV